MPSASHDLRSSETRVASSPLGPVPTGWSVVRLADISVKIGSGATPRGGESAYLPERLNFALIRSQNVFDRHFERQGLAFISDEQAGELRNAIVKEGDILLNITGDGITFSRSCLVPASVLPACVNQHVSIIRINKTVAYPGYILSFLTHPEIKHYIESFNAGGSRRAITKGHIESFQIPLPPLSEQRAIAHALNVLDQKIELNQQTSATLEAMARAIFKSWFVDFDPVRAKAEGRQLFGMNAETAALFPNSFEDSDIGSIPKGWCRTSVGNEVQLVKGVSYRSEELASAHTALVTLKSIKRGGGYRPDGLKGYVGQFKTEQIVGSGDLVVAQTDVTQAAEVIGKPALVMPQDTFRTLVASLDLLIVRPIRNDLTQEFFYLLFMTSDFQNHVYGHTNGTTVLHLSKTGVPSYEFPRPPETVGKAFARVVRPLLERITQNESQSTTLAAIRDALLPKLVSGEIRLKEFAGEASEVQV